MADKTFLAGDTVYLLESMRWLRKARVIRADGDFCVIRFADNNGGIRIRMNRLYATQAEAEAEIAAAQAARTAQEEKSISPESAPSYCWEKTFLAIRDSCNF